MISYMMFIYEHKYDESYMISYTSNHVNVHLVFPYDLHVLQFLHLLMYTYMIITYETIYDSHI